MKIIYRGLIVVAMLAVSVSAQANPPNYPTLPIELKYYSNGSWPVTVSVGGACCDSKGNKFDLFYPTNLGAGGFKHPILTWANGSFATASQCAYFLKHLASWGFVIIATEDGTTGVGKTVLDGAKFLIHANSDPASMFHGKLDVTNVGALGHSQGATGAINAMIKSGGTIKTVVPIELPTQAECASKTNCTDTKHLTQGSIFFVTGSEDIISPSWQFPWQSGEQSIAAYYDATPAGVLKVKGTLIGPNHLDIQGQPNCAGSALGGLLCTNGVYGYLGYPTAWLMARLQGDSYAAGAFSNPNGEIFHETTNWEFVGSNLP